MVGLVSLWNGDVSGEAEILASSGSSSSSPPCSRADNELASLTSPLVDALAGVGAVGLRSSSAREIASEEEEMT